MSRRVTYARLQTGLHAPTLGDFGAVLPPSGKTLTDLVMSTSHEGLSVTFSHKGIKMDMLIPYANIALMLLVPESKLPPPAVPISSKSLAV